MLESLFSTTTSATATVTIWQALLYAVIAGILGVLISLTYMKTGKISKNFARTLIILPILVCVVITMVNGNLGTSVAILGAFGLIRFRSLQGSSRDIGFIFFAMTVGLTCSVGYAIFAVMITVLVCAVMFLLQAIHFADRGVAEKDLRVTIPENLDYTDIFDELFEKYAGKHTLYKVKTTNMGSMYELFYRITLNDGVNEKEFLDQIRTRNGNLTVVCGRTDLEHEEL